MVDSYHVRIRRVWTRINLYLHIALQVKAMIFWEFSIFFLVSFNFLLSFKPITCCTEFSYFVLGCVGAGVGFANE